MEDVMDVKEMRVELYSNWVRLFKLCSATISDLESGKLTIRASLMKELSAMMVQCQTVIDEFEALQKQAQREEELQNIELPEFDKLKSQSLNSELYLPFVALFPID
jgi:hypothetical protein